MREKAIRVYADTSDYGGVGIHTPQEVITRGDESENV